MTDNSTLMEAFQTLVDVALASGKGGFRVNAYRKVLKALQSSDTPPLNTEEALDMLRVNGMALKTERRGGPYKSGILLKFGELFEKGNLAVLEKAKVDPEVKAVRDLVRIPEIGPAKAKALYGAGITSVAELEKLVAVYDKEGRGDADYPIHNKQRLGLRHYRDLEKRIPRTEMDQWRDYLEGVVEALDIPCHACELVGSYRRGAENSGDIDFHICVDKGESHESHLTVLRDIYEYLVSDGILTPSDVWSRGDHKLMAVVKLDPGYTHRHLDVWIFTEEQYPAALLYATGSATFNIEMRNHAISLGWSLSDKGLRKGSPKGRPPTEEECQEKLGYPGIRSEQDIFRFLGLEWVEPPHRGVLHPTELLSNLPSDDVEC